VPRAGQGCHHPALLGSRRVSLGTGAGSGAISTAIERAGIAVAVITPEDVVAARRDLGRRLAALRQAAGLTQVDLAGRVSYSRSTIGNAEVGRGEYSRRFWQRCDRELGADGALLAAHDEFASLVFRHEGVRRRTAALSSATDRVNGAHHNGVTVVADIAGQVHDLLLSAAQREPGRHFTLHVDFTADDPRRAREVAMALAEGLGILRPEVATYSAAVSTGGTWSDAEPVFCMADGPDGAFCADIAGHPGWHSESGITGMRWGEADGEGTKG